MEGREGLKASPKGDSQGGCIAPCGRSPISIQPVTFRREGANELNISTDQQQLVKIILFLQTFMTKTVVPNLCLIPFGEVSYEIPCISDIYIMIHNSIKMTVMK